MEAVRMVSRSAVRALVGAGATYEDVGRRLGIHAGLAYMIATGLPADGGDASTDAERERSGYLTTSTQHLANPETAENPTHHDEVQQWILQRVQRDTHMQQAGAQDWPKPPPLGDTHDDADVA